MSNSTITIAPDEFSATASAAVRACSGLDPSAAARCLAADGLLGVLASESVGGLGLPLDYAVPVAAEAGAGLLGFALVETLLLARAFERIAPDIASRLVSGERTATVAWRGIASVRQDGSGLSLTGVVDRAPLAAAVEGCLVMTTDGGATLIMRTNPGVTVESNALLALESPDAIVTLNNARMAPGHDLSASAWDAMVRDALVLRAAAILGSGERSIANAVEHVSTRRQFGTALVANQAVRHRLARHKLELEGVRNAIARHLSTPSDLTARAVFLHACHAGVAAAEGAIQLHGGMGFTWDVPMHRHLRQIHTLAQQGNADAVRDAMAARLIDTRNAADVL